MSDIPLLPQVEAFLRRPHGLFIDGVNIRSHSSQTLAVTNPATGDVIAQVADADLADIDAAVNSANRGFQVWSQALPATRSNVLLKLADLLEERAEEFARVESHNTGKPLKFSSAFDLPLSIDNLRYFASAARNLEGKASGVYLEGSTSTIPREP